MSDLLANLTYPEALAALRIVAEKVAEREGKKMDELEAQFQKEAANQNIRIPVAASDETEDWKQNGPRFIDMLRALLSSDEEFLKSAAESAILSVKGKGEAHGFIALTFAVGTVVFAIGLLSKIEYSKEKGLIINKGFPNMQKIPAVVRAFFGGAGTGGAGSNEA